MNGVHVAVTRQVKPGCEADFEEALREFARESLRIPGTTGVHLIQPVPVEEQVLVLYTVTEGHMDDIPVEDVRRFERGSIVVEVEVLFFSASVEVSPSPNAHIRSRL